MCPYKLQFDWLSDQFCLSRDRVSDHFAKHCPLESTLPLSTGGAVARAGLGTRGANPFRHPPMLPACTGRAGSAALPWTAPSPSGNVCVFCAFTFPEGEGAVQGRATDSAGPVSAPGASGATGGDAAACASNMKTTWLPSADTGRGALPSSCVPINGPPRRLYSQDPGAALLHAHRRCVKYLKGKIGNASFAFRVISKRESHQTMKN